MTRRAPCCLIAIALACSGLVTTARADDLHSEEARKHFQRGVALFNEADYHAALVEFKRAYEIAPNAAVLYNIGQTYYQLQNYALALVTLERYVKEAGASAAHAAEVRQTIDTLRTRVGNIEITTNVPDCEITIDDELVGKSPLAQPISVSIGRRKIEATHAGRTPETRFVEVAAGDTMKIALVLTDPNEHVTQSAPIPVMITQPSPVTESHRAGWIKFGWASTIVLAATGITMGALSYNESRELQNDRNSFPVTADDLTTKASRVSTFAHIGDGLGIAAVVVGGVTLAFTLSHSDSHEVHAGLSPTGIVVGGTFK